MKKLLLAVLFINIFQGFGQAKKVTPLMPPALSAIKDADLKSDLFDIASDAFRGRRTGTTDELRAAMWVAQKAQQAGLKPAGDDGTYFQWFSLKRTKVDDNSTFKINGKSLAFWKDVYASSPVAMHYSGPVMWLKSAVDTGENLQGKVVAINMYAPSPLPLASQKSWNYRYLSSAVRQITAVARRHGATSLIIVMDDIANKAVSEFGGHNYQDGTYQLQGARTATNARAIPVLLVGKQYAADLQQPNGSTIEANIQVDSYLYPTVNVIAVAPGTDVALKNQYVLFSGHSDHDGVWNGGGQDSIFNGADDNASVTVGMLAIGRAWISKPGKRPALFVWHGAEERGLLGSKYYAAHPTVKKEDIVAVLNADMIGRNNLDSAALLGSTPPHRNSTMLVNMAMQANDLVTHFKVDISWDDPKHAEGWYFRSDHASYAAVGIPALMYSSLLHNDYHTNMDNPDRIDIAKLAKITKWMYATGWLVSQSEVRVVVDK